MVTLTPDLLGAAVVAGLDVDEVPRADPLTVLGADIFHIILGYLDIKDIVRAERVCSAWRAFSASDGSLWMRVSNKKLDMHEWERTVRERAQRAQRAQRAGSGEHRVTDIHSVRDATLGNLELERGWAKRHIYETLFPLPAFKLRHVCLDPGEDFLYALTDGEPEDRLLVIDRYTGDLLLTIPWITSLAAISVGAGYVVVSTVPGVDPEEEGSGGAYSDPLKALHVYRTANAAERAMQLSKGATEPFKHERGLPLEFFTTIDALAGCRAFRVKLATRARPPQAVLAGASEDGVVLCYLEDGCRVERIVVENLRSVDSLVNYGELNAHVTDINFDDSYLYVLTQHQMHVINRETGTKLFAYPGPLLVPCEQAGLAYQVMYNFPFGFPHTGRPSTVPQHTPDIELAYTREGNIRVWRPDTDQDEFEETLGHHDEEHRMDDYRRVLLTDNDLILRRDQALVPIVRNYRAVLAHIATLPSDERLAYWVSCTAAICFFGEDCIDEVQTWDNRLYCHGADITLFCFDLDQIPPMPLVSDEQGFKAKAYCLEVSCLQGIQTASSFAVDARAIFLADWDNGRPDGLTSYEDLHYQDTTHSTWPHAIRPNWGCVKVWTARPESALLTKSDYPRLLSEYMRKVLDNPGTPKSTDSSGSEMSDVEESPPAVHNPFIDDDYAGALGWVFDGEVPQDEGHMSDNSMNNGNLVEEEMDKDDLFEEEMDGDEDLEQYADDDHYQSLFDPDYQSNLGAQHDDPMVDSSSSDD